MLSVDDLIDLSEYKDDELYGLFDICSRRFVYTHSNRHLLKYIALLFSSRYTLWVCRLDCASNFKPNIIDNDVAHNWSIDFSESRLAMSGNVSYIRHPLPVNRLIPAITEITSTLLFQELEYIKYVVELFAWMLKNLTSRHDGYVHEIDSEFKDVIDTPFIHDRAKLYNDIFRVIYLQPEFHLAKKEIDELLQR